MSECLFCRIARREIPAEIVHDTPGAVAFLDTHPAARGHVLVIPRDHAPTLLDLDDAAVGALFAAVKAVQVKVQAALQPRGFNVGWTHGRAGGQYVFHLHVHVLPRYGLLGRGVQKLGEGGDATEVAALAAAIRAA